MTTDDGAALHNRSTRGEQLTPAEQQILDTWYREQDQAEFFILEQSTPAPDIAALREQLTIAMQHLGRISQSINATLQANTALRHEIARLQGQLLSRVAGQAA